MGRFRKFALIFFISRVINMLFLFTSLSKLPGRRFDERGGFVLINCQILRIVGKENPQQLVKRITCCNLGLKVHSNLKAFR